MDKVYLSPNILPYRSISFPTEEIIDYINSRRSGTVKSLKTRWSKFNDACMGGIEPNTILSIAGISGSGDKVFINLTVTYLNNIRIISKT